MKNIGLRTLYGASVKTSQYAKLKKITDLLVGESDHREYIDTARQRCVAIAIAALANAQTKAKAEMKPQLVRKAIDESFLRREQRHEPINQIIYVEINEGSRAFVRVALNAEQMSLSEARLMELQHHGDIKSYLLAGANDFTFLGLMTWLQGLGYHPEQPNLVDVQQDTLFASGS